MPKDYIKFVKPSGKVASKEIVKNLRDHRVEPHPKELDKIMKKMIDPSYFDTLIKAGKVKRYRQRDLDNIDNRAFILSSIVKEKDIIIPRQEFVLRVVRTPIVVITNDHRWIVYGRNTIFFNEKRLKNKEIMVTEINATRFFGFIRTKEIEH